MRWPGRQTTASASTPSIRSRPTAAATSASRCRCCGSRSPQDVPAGTTAIPPQPYPEFACRRYEDAARRRPGSARVTRTLDSIVTRSATDATDTGAPDARGPLRHRARAVTLRPLRVIELPGAAQIVRRAGATVLVATVFPMTVFYLTFALTGLKVAVAATVVWYYSGLLWRFARGRPMLGAAVLGAGLLTLRAVLMFWTGSAFLYFLQPVAGTVATATAIALTALAGRPLLERLAHDFFPLPPPLTERLRANRFFQYASVVWALTYLVNAVGTVWLLSSSSVGSFLVLKTLLSPLLTGLAVALTYGLLRVLMRRERVHIRWGHPEAEEAGRQSTPAAPGRYNRTLAPPKQPMASAAMRSWLTNARTIGLGPRSSPRGHPVNAA